MAMAHCCCVQGKKHIPLEQRPEATFLPALLDHFLELISTTIKAEPVKSEAPDTNGAVGATATDANGDDDAMHIDNEPTSTTLATNVAVQQEAGGPVRFFEDPNEPLRLEDLPAEPDEAQLLDSDEDDPAPGMTRSMHISHAGRCGPACCWLCPCLAALCIQRSNGRACM